ncbi:MAG: competence protein [Alphaproteobacteria bacterium]|nr:competence protein [Alphaproteobacteria bacterium]
MEKNFPAEWQEFIQHDQSGEKHIADIRTKLGLVIEFQRSHLDPQELAKRESFYQNMVWVVDGTRLKKPYEKFLKGKKGFRPTDTEGLFYVASPEACFPANWLQSSVPIFLDFLGVAPIHSPDETRELLWCLLPERIERSALVYAMPRKDFVEKSSNESKLLQDIVSCSAQIIRQSREAKEAETIEGWKRYIEEKYHPQRRHRRL